MASTGNAGFAFVVNSLLNSNKAAKILSKAKKESDTKIEVATNDHVPELVDETGAVKKQDDVNIEQVPTTNKRKRVKVSKFTRQQLESIARTKPKLEDKPKEKRLATIATKGVVQLFNVVKEQQKQIKEKVEEAGSSGTKRAKVMSEFSEEKLFQKINQKEATQDEQNASQGKKKKKWSVLSDDFMTGAKFKDWDKESDSD